MNVAISVQNTNDADAGIISVSGSCECVSDVRWFKSIAAKETREISFELNPDVYASTRSIDTTIKIFTKDKDLEHVNVRVLGVIDADSLLLTDPVKIFDTYAPAQVLTEKKYEVLFFSAKNGIDSIKFVKIANKNRAMTITFAHDFLPIKYGRLTSAAKMEVVVDFLKLDPKEHLGELKIELIHADKLRTISLPYHFVRK